MAVCVPTWASEATRVALSEGVCPTCGTRLTPVRTVSGAVAGRCPVHGVGAAWIDPARDQPPVNELLDGSGDRWLHTGYGPDGSPLYSRVRLGGSLGILVDQNVSTISRRYGLPAAGDGEQG